MVKKENLDTAGPIAAEDQSEPMSDAQHVGVVDVTTSASGEKDARSISIPLNLGKNLAEASEVYGEDVVHRGFARATIVDFQGFIRRLLKQTDPVLSDDDIKEKAKTWAPAVKTIQAKKSKMEKARDFLKNLSPAERKQLLADSGLDLSTL